MTFYVCVCVCVCVCARARAWEREREREREFKNMNIHNYKLGIQFSQLFLYADLICYDEAISLSPINPPKIKIIDMGFFHITFILHKSQ